MAVGSGFEPRPWTKYFHWPTVGRGKPIVQQSNSKDTKGWSKKRTEEYLRTGGVAE